MSKRTIQQWQEKVNASLGPRFTSRIQRAAAMVAADLVSETGPGRYEVHSQSRSNGHYTVEAGANTWHCDCPDFEHGAPGVTFGFVKSSQTRKYCKHILAIRAHDFVNDGYEENLLALAIRAIYQNKDWPANVPYVLWESWQDPSRQAAVIRIKTQASISCANSRDIDSLYLSLSGSDSLLELARRHDGLAGEEYFATVNDIHKKYAAWTRQVRQQQAAKPQPEPVVQEKQPATITPVIPVQGARRDDPHADLDHAYEEQQGRRLERMEREAALPANHTQGKHSRMFK